MYSRWTKNNRKRNDTSWSIKLGWFDMFLGIMWDRQLILHRWLQRLSATKDALCGHKWNHWALSQGKTLNPRSTCSQYEPVCESYSNWPESQYWWRCPTMVLIYLLFAVNDTKEFQNPAAQYFPILVVQSIWGSHFTHIALLSIVGQVWWTKCLVV